MHLAKRNLLLGLALQFGLAGVALAAASEAEIARLGQDLTCVGAEKVGNADGSIPEWSGKWLGVPPHVNFTGTGAHPIDPYPDDKPLSTALREINEDLLVMEEAGGQANE